MSNVEAEARQAVLPREWDQLELVVRRLLDDFEQWKRRALAAEARVRELEVALHEVTGGKVDPLALAERVETLEAENEALRQRLARAGEHVSRILSRLAFLEEDR